MGDRAFIASAPTLWNDLPLEIRMAKSVHIFLWPSCYFLQVRPWCVQEPMSRSLQLP